MQPIEPRGKQQGDVTDSGHLQGHAICLPMLQASIFMACYLEFPAPGDYAYDNQGHKLFHAGSLKTKFFKS
jgi:hypothetical protein